MRLMVAWEAHARPSEDAEEDWSRREGGREKERERLKGCISR